MILVTGGTGFIGSHLVERVAAKGMPARVFVRGPIRKSLPGQIQLAHGDLVTGKGIAESLEDVDTVLHLAGVTKALSSDDYYAGNVRASENLARAVANSGREIRFVCVSSLAAIGPAPDSIPLREDAAPHPLTSYGKSKLEAEQSVRAILPGAVIVRPPVVYGPRDTDVFQLLKSISRGIVVQIAGGERYFSAIYVSDLVEGILAASREPRAAGREYFLAHPQPASWSEFGAITARILKRTSRVVNLPVGAAFAVARMAEWRSALTRKPGIISREKIREAQCRYWLCDSARATEELGFTAATAMEDGLTRTLSWYREAGWLKF